MWSGRCGAGCTHVHWTPTREYWLLRGHNMCGRDRTDPEHLETRVWGVSVPVRILRTEQNNRPGRGASRHSSPRSRLVGVAPARRARVQLCRPSRACRPASRLVSLYPIHDRTDAARTCVTREAPKPRTPEYVGVRASGALHPGLAAAVPPPPAHEQRQRTAPSTGRMLEPSIASSVASAPSSGHERSSLLTDCEQDAGSKL